MTPKGQRFLEILRQRVLIGDGAMGTMLHERGVPWEVNLDSLNLTAPELVQSIHREYLAAGAEFLETNTFGANRNKLEAAGWGEKVREINRQGARLAREVAPEGVFVAGSVGPLGPGHREGVDFLTDDDKVALFKEQIEALLEGGVDLIILETFPFLDELKLALRAAKEVGAEVPIVAQMTFLDKPTAEATAEAVRAALELSQAGADVIGGNCGSGPGYLLKVLRVMAEVTDCPISAFPNLSFPQYMDGRFVYRSEPEYFVQRAEEIYRAGATLIGGCCGTTPEHIRQLAQRLKGLLPAPRRLVSIHLPERKAPPPRRRAPFLDRVGKEPVLIVELETPRGTLYERVLTGARMMADEGVHAISVAENPLASIRMSSLVLSYLIQREVGLTAICHITCRDRNLLGLHSELLGADALGVHTILALTGDPISVGGVAGVSAVFDVNSFGLIQLLRSLNEGQNALGRSIERPTNFTIGVAFDPNRTRLEAEVHRLEKKTALGADFAMSQMLYDASRIRQMYRSTRHIPIPIFAGFMPLVSARNAEFLHNEVPGFKIPEAIRRRMHEAPPGTAWQEGIRIAKELIEVALESGAPGIYLVTPFQRVGMILELVRHVQRVWAS